MLEGFWTVEFGSSSGLSGGGVVWFRDGAIEGGDSGYYYSGKYKLLHIDTFEVQLIATPFITSYVSVFGTRGHAFVLQLVGQVKGSTATAQGYLVGMPDMKFGARLIRRQADEANR